MPPFFVWGVGHWPSACSVTVDTLRLTLATNGYETQCTIPNRPWAAMIRALDESRNAFSRAIEVTARRLNEAAKG